MKLKRFIAKDVHGYIDFDISFREQLTFLIGINGAGKTTALKLLLGLITPSFKELSQIRCSYAELICSNNESIRIILERTEELIKLKLIINNQETSGEFQVISMESQSEMSTEMYRERFAVYKERFSELEVVKKIEDLLTPYFLGLDRRIFATSERIQRTLFSKHAYIKPPSFEHTDKGLQEVQQLVFDYTRQIARQQLRISNTFKNKIFKNSFHFVENTNVNIQNISEELEKLKERSENLNEAIKNLEIGNVSDEIIHFFKRMEETIKKVKELQQNRDKNKNKEISERDFISHYTKWFINGHQLDRIDEIINLSNEYQEQIQRLREPIERLEKIANRFLLESNKSFKVSGDGDIKVIIQKMKKTQMNSIFELSSGERQIIIMIAHLIFCTNLSKSPIFVIDEPELSLHIAWQEIFVDSIIKASPNTQFILATHSPSIISKVEREEFCEDLTKK